MIATRTMLALATLIGVSIAVAEEQPVASCKILASPEAKPRDGDDAYYWYDAIDIHGGAECVASLVPDAPPLVFRFVPERGGWNAFEAVEVTMSDGHTLQRLERPRRPSRFYAPPASTPFLRVEDIDFDGHPDIGVFVRSTIPGNALYQYWRFEADARRFVTLDAPDVPNPRVDVAAKTLVGESHEGAAGKLFTRTAYRVRNDRLEPVHLERRQWIDGRYVQTAQDFADGDPTSTQETPWPFVPRRPFDRDEWHVVASATGHVGRGPRSQTLLLASREVTDLSGFEQPLHDTNLVIVDRGEVVYRLRDDPPRPHPIGESSRCSEPRDLELRDVTRDGVADILFWCGYVAVSDAATWLHIIHYDADRHAFRDVTRDEFVGSNLSDVEWRTFGKMTVALTAHAEWRDGEGHYEPHYYDYAAYCWDAKARDFTRVYSARSDARHDDTTWRADRESRRSAIAAAVRRACR